MNYQDSNQTMNLPPIDPQDVTTAFDFDIEGVAGLVGVNPAEQRTPKKKVYLSRKQKKQLKREYKAQLRQLKGEARENKREVNRLEKKQRNQSKSISAKLKERDKAISDRTKINRNKRKNANNIVDYIGYEKMFRDGICEVEEGVFSQTVSFPDISYQSAREDSQKDIFKTMCAIYDYFDPSVSLQFSVVNTQLRTDEIGTREFFKENNQKTEQGREDARLFNKILNQKMKEGISNIKRNRYLTYSVAAPNVDSAMPLLARIRTDISGFFAKIGCNIEIIDGYNRLKLLFETLNPEEPFCFNYDTDISLHGAYTTKDAIAPSALDFKPDGENSCFKADSKWCQVLCFRKFGSELNDRVVSDLVDLPIPMTVTWHVEPWNKAEAILQVKRTNSMVDSEIVNEQKNSANKGRDFTVLSQEIKYNKEEFEEVLDNLQNNNQNLFTFTGLVHVYANTKEELDNRVIQIISAARVKSVTINTLNYQQREGLNSVLPLGLNHVEQSRTFTTAQISIFMPFATQELDDAGGNYAGQNKNSNNLVIVNRKKLASPVGFICGKTGSGKSFFVKQEIEGTILQNPNDQILIFDRAGEYSLLTEHHNGTIFKFGVDSDTYLNPFDMSSNREQSTDAQIANKVDAMIAQSSAAAADAGQGLSEEDQSIIARSVELAFKRARDKDPKAVPLLSDFYNILNEQNEEAAKTIALRYERFVTGTMSFFNKKSNVNWDNRIIDINIKELPDSMLIFCLITMCESARNQMYSNFEKGKRTWIYIEEIQSMFKYPSVLNYFSRFANEARKFGGLLTGITQNSVAMLGNDAARPIVLNADFIMLLKQSPVDRSAWEDLLALSTQEVGFVDETADKGAGLLISGASRIPIVGGFPKNNALYDLFSTDPNEVEELHIKKQLEANKKNM